MNPRFTTVHGVILAAGASTRMGTPKALLEYRGSTFLARMIEALRPVCDSVAVVIAPGSGGIQAICDEFCVEAVINPAPQRGMLSSLQCALAWRDAGGYLFTPVDYPMISPGTVAAIAAAFRTRGRDCVIPIFGGRRGHPVCISRAVAGQILALPAGASARDAIHAADTLYLPLNDAGILLDVDTPAEYETLSAGERP